MADTDQSNDTAPSRSWLPSPGCLFAVTLLVALTSVCGWVGWRVQRQQARLEYFEQVGRSVETEPASPVWLHDLVIATLGEEHAAGFTDVTVLNLNRTQVTDTGLRHVKDFSNLKRLFLILTQVTDAGLQHLGGLTNLEWLYLTSTQITDAGLQHLSGLTNLEKLGLDDTQVTDTGLQHLSFRGWSDD